MTAESSISLEKVGFCLMIAGFILGGLAFAASSVSAYLLYRSSAIAQSESNERITNAQTTAAVANNKTAELEVETAQAKLEAQKLKVEMAWRRINSEQAKTLIDALKTRTNLEIQVQGLHTDPEAAQFHQDIYTTLGNAGIQPSTYTGIEQATGLWIFGNDDADVTFVTKVFGNVGIELHRRAEHAFGATGHKVVIIVGSKPPVFFTSPNGPATVNWYEQSKLQ